MSGHRKGYSIHFYVAESFEVKFLKLIQVTWDFKSKLLRAVQSEIMALLIDLNEQSQYSGEVGVIELYA